MWLASCNSITTWDMNLNKESKDPFGTYIARKSLPLFFKTAQQEDLPLNYSFGALENIKQNNDRRLVILSGKYLGISQQELHQLKHFAEKGNEIVIFTNDYNETVSEFLNVVIQRDGGSLLEPKASDSTKPMSAVWLATDTSRKYTCEHFPNNNFFTPFEEVSADSTATDSTTQMDTLHYSDNTTQALEPLYVDSQDTTGNAALVDSFINASTNEPEYSTDTSTYYIDTLGYTGSYPNLIRATIGSGHITIHASPIVITNYFLLKTGNVEYLAGIWATLPSGITKIYWLDFFDRTVKPSSPKYLFDNPPIRYALLLAIIGTLLYVLFQKRRQRPIPILPPLQNDSVSFVETIGRLYFNKGDNGNLADKMVQQFLEWVRSHYYLNTNALDPAFISQLSRKSGLGDAKASAIVEMIHEIRVNQANPSDEYLFQLYNITQEFYKNKR